MILPAWAVKYSTIVMTLVVLLMAWGTYTFFNMPRREDPEFTIRVCVVSTQWPGAPAEKVEELVTDKIEQELVSIEEVDQVRSTTKTGLSTVYVELDDRIAPADIQNVWDKVRARVELVKMPDDSIRPVVNDEFGDTAVLVLAIHQTVPEGETTIKKRDIYSYRELEEFAEIVQDAVRLLPGVAKVDMFGVREEAVYIETDMGNWSQIDLTIDYLQKLASERNIIEPGGELETEQGHFTVLPGGEFSAIEEIEQIASVVRSGTEENNVYLSDLGLSVHRDYEDPPSRIGRYSDVNGSQPAVMLGITMKSGSNIIDICNRSKDRIQQLVEQEQMLPRNVAVTPISDQSENVGKKITEVIVNVLQAILIVVAVVYIVVGFRTSFVMAANIPVVVIASIGLISFMGVQIEQISLAALIISLGLLVDNAVQVCDQARTNQIAGMNPREAAIEGAKTLAIPMLVGTLTTVAAFLPMLIALSGGSKEYIYSLPVTVSTTLGVSWVLAMTLCVILAALFIKAPKDDMPGSPILALFTRVGRLFRKKKQPTENELPEEGEGTGSKNLPSEQESLASKEPIKKRENFVFVLYDFFGTLALQAKWITVAICVAIFFVVMALPVSSEFFPQADRDQFAIKVSLPETATIAQADEIAQQVEEVVRKLSPIEIGGQTQERLRAMRTLVGGGGSRWHLGWDPESPSRNFAEILVRTSSGSLTTQFAQDVRDACERGNAELGIEPIVGARIVPVELALGPPADPLVLRVVGNGFADPKRLREVSEKLKVIVNDQPETWNVADSWGTNGYQIRVDVDKDLATLAGVTNSQVAKTLNSYYSGHKLTTFREGDHQIPIYFRLRPEQRASVRGLQESYVEGDNGKIPLNSFAKFKFSWELAKIQRRDMNRVIEVSSRMEPGVTGNDVVNRVLNSDEFKELEANLPAGFHIEPGGSYAESADASVQMLTSFGLSFVMIVLCLIFQYNGWSKPIVILATLPLALVGAWMGLYLTDNSLGFMPQLGILALFGIVLNTAIIFIEFADIVIEDRALASDGSGPIVGLTKKEFRACLIEAGKQRMLPIFLTTATTVGGLIPLALSGGPLWEGLAWCMIFGLLFATVLTLFAVPAFYAILVETFRINPIPTIVPQEAEV